MVLFRESQRAAIRLIQTGVLVLCLGGVSASAADITVFLDEAKLVKLPERVATLVIGNPLIADATIQNGGLMVITGKGYGSTNVIALDRTSAVLFERNIEVTGPRDHTVVVYRGINRETYSCAPYCEQRIAPGDNNTVFENILNQTVLRSGLASGIAPAKSDK
jgi:hypothetical protein